MAAVLGLEAQGTADYNYLVNGTVLPVGAPVDPRFREQETEMYVQDTWKVTRNFTITAGIRLGLEPPVHEVNGQQASTNIPLASWLGARANYAEQGLSQQNAGLIDFIPRARERRCIPSIRTGRLAWVWHIRRRQRAGFRSGCSAVRAKPPSAPAPECITI